MTYFKIRTEMQSDHPAIADVVLTAFGSDEGPVVNRMVIDLRTDPTAQPSLGLVAIQGEAITGYIFFSNARLKTNSPVPLKGCILAPLAVHPAHQSQGIGGQLIATATRQFKQQGMDLVFLAGYPDYYSRHGFTAATPKGWRSPYPMPAAYPDAWMVQSLRPSILGTVTGQVYCAKPLDDPACWRE